MPDDDRSRSEAYLPFIFSFITVRQERFGAIIYNPYLDMELALDPVEAHIVGLCNGRNDVRDIEAAVRDKFTLKEQDSRRRVFFMMNRLSKAYALGFGSKADTAGKYDGARRRFPKNGPYLSSPKMVTWEVTYACNLHCPHCFTESGRPGNNELDTEGAFLLIDKLAEAKVLRLLITGGEPFLRPDILEILEKVSTTGIRLDIATNGIELPDRVLKGIRNLPVLHMHVSMDGIGMSHDRFRGRRGAFEAACRNIRRMQDENINVSLSMTVTGQNIDEVEQVIDLALEMGCQGFFANAMLPVGRGKKIIHEHPLGADDYYRFYRTLVEKGKELRGRLEISGDMCFPFLFSSPRKGMSTSGSMGCSAGYDTLCIGADGIAYPCHFLHDFPLGDLTETSLMSLWKNSPALRDMRNVRKQDMAEPCHSCQFAPGACRGGCRAAAYLVSGDLRGMDPTCFKSVMEQEYPVCDTNEV